MIWRGGGQFFFIVSEKSKHSQICPRFGGNMGKTLFRHRPFIPPLLLLFPFFPTCPLPINSTFLSPPLSPLDFPPFNLIYLKSSLTPSNRIRHVVIPFYPLAGALDQLTNLAQATQDV